MRKKIIVLVCFLLVFQTIPTSAQTTLLLPQIQGEVYQIIDEGGGVFVFGSVQPASGEYTQIGPPLATVKGLSQAVSTINIDGLVQHGEDEVGQRNLFVVNLADGVVTTQPVDIVLLSIEQDQQNNLYGFDGDRNLLAIDQMAWTTEIITNVAALDSIINGVSTFGNDEYYVAGEGTQGTALIRLLVAINVTTKITRLIPVDYVPLHIAYRQTDDKLVGVVNAFEGTANFPFFAVIDPLTGQIEQGYRLDPYISSLPQGMSALDANDNYLFSGGDWDGNDRLYAITPGDNVLHIGPIQTKRGGAPAAVTLKSFEVKRGRIFYFPLLFR